MWVVPSEHFHRQLRVTPSMAVAVLLAGTHVPVRIGILPLQLNQFPAPFLRPDKGVCDTYIADESKIQEVQMAIMTERAVLAGGCFWGMQDLIRRYPGVVSTRVGYTGGDVPHATYRNHGSHAEAIEIAFDPARTSFRDLLELFFQIHDPTTRNRQGNDVGASYRSAIFYVNEEQKLIAEETIADVNASGLWPGQVVTEVAPVKDFWEAEPEHQDYLERYPNGYTCHFPRPNWKLPKQREVRRAG